MNIKDKAKKIINEAIIAEKANAIHLHTEHSCCGTSLRIEIININETH